MIDDVVTDKGPPLGEPKGASSTLVEDSRNVDPQKVHMAGTKNGGAGPRAELVLVSAAVGSVTAVTGAVLLGVGHARYQELYDIAPRNADGRPRCPSAPAAHPDAVCDAFRRQAQSAATMAQAGVGVLVGAGAVGVAIAIYALWPRSARSAKAGPWLPVVGPQHGGLVWSGSF